MQCMILIGPDAKGRAWRAGDPCDLRGVDDI